MLNRLLCTAVLLVGATTLRADVFAFSYSGSTLLWKDVTVTGTVTASFTGASLLGGVYTITDLTGIRTVNNIKTSISDTSDNEGTFTYSDLTSFGNLNFLVGKSTNVTTLGWLPGGVAYEDAKSLTSNSAGTLSISRVPEVATLSLLLTMGLGVWVFARKFSPKKTRLS